MPKRIPLTQGKYAIVDDEDYEELSQYKWQVLCSNGRWAALSTFSVNGKNKMIYMHRMIMKPPQNMCIDHINHDTLDNRKQNLRMCTRSQNQWNKKIQKNNKVGYKGVSIFPYINKKYRAMITVNGKGKTIGYFYTPEEAHEAYKKAAQKYYGEFACAG